jgi:acyl carrier protein
MKAHMSQEEFEGYARQFIEQQTGRSGGEIDSDTDLLATGIVDSLLLVEFFFFLEQLAECDIPSETVKPERISTLTGAYQLLSEHLSSRAS